MGFLTFSDSLARLDLIPLGPERSEEALAILRDIWEDGCQHGVDITRENEYG